MTNVTELPTAWMHGIQLLTAYLDHLWESPNYDCWEEFPDKVHISTLCALHGGLATVGKYTGNRLAVERAEHIRTFIKHVGLTTGYLPKFLGTDMVDASLIWACIPFRVVAPDDPLMVRTIQKITMDLRKSTQGVHRYVADNYYGGGEWILLTALLGEYLAACGNADAAVDILGWIEKQASAAGELPEQVPHDLNIPDAYEPWVDKWGPSASPLLWSHAAYSRLLRVLQEVSAV